MHRSRQSGNPKNSICLSQKKNNKYWTKEEHKEITEHTLQSLEMIIKRSQRVTLVGDFNCSEVKWETFEIEGENTW